MVWGPPGMPTGNVPKLLPNLGDTNQKWAIIELKELLLRIKVSGLSFELDTDTDIWRPCNDDVRIEFASGQTSE